MNERAIIIDNLEGDELLRYVMLGGKPMHNHPGKARRVLVMLDAVAAEGHPTMAEVGMERVGELGPAEKLPAVKVA